VVFVLDCWFFFNWLSLFWWIVGLFMDSFFFHGLFLFSLISCFCGRLLSSVFIECCLFGGLLACSWISGFSMDYFFFHWLVFFCGRLLTFFFIDDWFLNGLLACSWISGFSMDYFCFYWLVFFCGRLFVSVSLIIVLLVDCWLAHGLVVFVVDY